MKRHRYDAAIEAGERERLPRPNWLDAKDVLCEIALRAGIAIDRRTIGRIRHIGDGLSNVVFGGTARSHEIETDLVVKLPSPRAMPDRDDRLRKEATVLRHLHAQRLTFAIPRPIAEVETSAGLAVVQEWVDGLEVDLRAPRFRGGKPWEFVATVAAAIHAIDPAPIHEHLPTHLTRRGHRLGGGAGRRSRLRPGDRDARTSQAVWRGERARAPCGGVQSSGRISAHGSRGTRARADASRRILSRRRPRLWTAKSAGRATATHVALAAAARSCGRRSVMSLL